VRSGGGLIAPHFTHSLLTGVFMPSIKSLLVMAGVALAVIVLKPKLPLIRDL
jgi:hypothetical protein